MTERSVPWEVFITLLPLPVALLAALGWRWLGDRGLPPHRQQPRRNGSATDEQRFFSAAPSWVPIGFVIALGAMLLLYIGYSSGRGNAPDYGTWIVLAIPIVFGLYYLHCLIHRPVLELTRDEVARGMFHFRRTRVPIARIRGVRRTAEDRIELETDDRTVKLWLGQIAAGERDAVFDAIRRRVETRGTA